MCREFIVESLSKKLKHIVIHLIADCFLNNNRFKLTRLVYEFQVYKLSNF